MARNNSSGAALALIVACAVLVTMVGVGFVFLAMLFGGIREAQNSVDSGNLNVAKQAVKIGVNLSDASPISQSNFAGLVDSNGAIDLLTYNRCVAQYLLVALNAADEGTEQAATNANILRIALKDGGTAGGVTVSPDKALGNILHRYLMDAAKSANAFGIAQNNSLRQLGDNQALGNVATGYDVAYLEPNGPTNVYWDTSIIPAGAPIPANMLTTVSSPQSANGNQKYMAGYTDVPITIAGQGIRGVPMQPNQSPHLVSERTFAERRDPVNLRLTFQPPNTFKSKGVTGRTIANSAATVISSAICASRNVDFPASIPTGYLKIVNPIGYGGTRKLPSSDNIFNNELMTGIYLMMDKNNTVLGFSADPSAANAMTNFCNSPTALAAPPFYDTNGDPKFFDTAGNPVLGLGRFGSIASGNQAAHGSNLVVSHGPCVTQNTTNVAPDPYCASTLIAFKNAFPGDPDGSTENSAMLTAAEYWKAEVLYAFSSIAWPEWNRVMNHGIDIGQPISPTQADVKVYVYPPSDSRSDYANDPSVPLISPPLGLPTYSGLRYFNQAGIYADAPPFTNAGSIAKYFNQIGSDVTVNNQSVTSHDTAIAFQSATSVTVQADATVNASLKAVMNEVLQRLRQIKPELRDKTFTDFDSIQDSDLQGIFGNSSNAGKVLELGSTCYIYMDQATRRLLVSDNPPAWVNASQSPDGNPRIVAGSAYPSIGNLVDVSGELGFHDVPFYSPPNQGTSGQVTDEVIWTKSSGYNHLLGTLEFREYVRNGGLFQMPN